MAKPIAGYDQGVFGGLNLSSGVTNAAIMSAPELRTADISGLQKMAQNESLINALNSAKMERDLTPDIANARGELSKQVSSDLVGGPSTQLSNQWLKQGLMDQIGTGTDTGGGFARSALADSTRQDYYANRDLQQNKAAALLQANPQPTAGLDVGSLAGIVTQTKADNANALDNYKSQVLGFLGNQSSNVMNAFQQAMQMEAARRGMNASAANSMSASNAAQRGQIAGSIIGAVGNIGGGLMSM